MPRQFPPFQFGSTGDEGEASFQNYRNIGETIVKWAIEGEDSWPTTMEELKEALGPNIEISDKFTKLRVVQGDDSVDGQFEFVLRLPPKGQVAESKQIAEQNPDAVYGLPKLYTAGWVARKRDQDNQPFKQVDAFFARVADYTMRGCR